MSGKEVKSIAVSKVIMGAALNAIAAELEYQDATNCGRKFGVTGEIGEILVCEALGLRLVEDPRSEGFDAIDEEEKRIQIKTRRAEAGELPNDAGRLSKFSNHACDYALLGILNREYELVSVWRADYAMLLPIIGKHKGANPTIRQFKRIGRQVYP